MTKIFTMLVFLNFLFCSVVSFAFSADISPVILKLDSKQQTTSFNITNKSDKNLNYQISAKKWKQKNGVDTTTDTSDIIVTPPMVTIAPGAKQIVRVGLRSRAALGTEATYRLLLKELPIDIKQPSKLKNADKAIGDLNMLFDFSLPLFIAPAVENKNVAWNVKKLGSNKLRVQLQNKGNVHVQITNLALQDASGKNVSFSPNVAGRILSKQSQDWTLTLKEPLNSKTVEIVAATDWDDKYRDLNAVATIN